MIVFIFEYDTYTNGRAILQKYRVIPQTKRGKCYLVLFCINSAAIIHYYPLCVRTHTAGNEPAFLLVVCRIND